MDLSMRIHPEIQEALHSHQPLVALETTVITHGLPWPENLQMADSIETAIRAEGAIPATIGVLNGQIIVGMNAQEREALAAAEDARKISRRDLAFVCAQKLSGGTTVAGTLIIARRAGIKVFATGGIGGVHRHAAYDISADLLELSRNPLIVVCAGAKAILDLKATFELLETLGVPVAAYQSDELPAFYSRESSIPAHLRLNSPEEIARLAQAQWQLGLENAILIANPPPEKAALPFEKINPIIEQAIRQAAEKGIEGSDMTPYLLEQMKILTGGDSLRANLALLENNARLGAQIARAAAFKLAQKDI